MTTATLIGLGLYICLIIGLGYFGSKGETRSEFLVGGRKFGVLPIAISMSSSWLNALWILFIIALVSTDLLKYIWVTTGLSLGVVAVALLAPRIRDYAAEHDINTLTEYVWVAMGKRAASVVVIINLCIYFFWLVIELAASGQILASFMSLEYETAVLLMVAVVGIYLILGGFKALVQTDVVQYIFISLFALVLAFNIDYGVTIDWGGLLGKTEVSGIPNAFREIMIVFPAGLLASEVWQRVIACRDAATARKSMLWSLVFNNLPYIPLLLAVCIFVANGGDATDPSDVFHQIINGTIPPVFVPLVMIALFSVITSTVDTLTFITGQTVVNDGLMRYFPKLTKRPRFALKFGIFAALVSASYLALFFTNLVDGVYFILSFWVALGPVVLPVIFQKRPPSEPALFYSILICFVVLVGLHAFGHYTDMRGVWIFLAGLVAPLLIDRTLIRSRA